MSEQAFHSLPTHKAALAWDEIVSTLGFQPDILELRKFLGGRGYHLCTGMTFRKSSDRPPSDAQRRETSRTPIPRMTRNATF